jgi:hypothetical protein
MTDDDSPHHKKAMNEEAGVADSVSVTGETTFDFLNRQSGRNSLNIDMENRDIGSIRPRPDRLGQRD